WVPFMASGVVLTTDVTMLMQEQSYLFVAARDTSRLVALGQYSENSVVPFMETKLGGAKSYSVVVKTAEGFVTSQVAVPYKDVLVFGSMFTGENQLSGQVTMLVEAADIAQ
ncbi:MAG: hypothetical protein AAF386_07410, partial [Pseudomonadota bacterium]